MDFKSLLKEANVDAILLSNHIERNNSNFVYVTQEKNIDAWVLISDKLLLYVSPLEIGNVKTAKFNLKPMTKEMFKEIDAELKNKKVGLDFEYLSVNDLKRLNEKFKDVEFVDISKTFENKRMVKTDEEIEKIKGACDICDKIMDKVFSEGHKFKTELELKEFMENEMKKFRVTPSFPTIVASGKNSAIPHHVPDNTKLKGFTVLDFGVVYGNYCSDISRTIYFGMPSKEEKENYTKVLSIQQECTNMIKEGVKFKDIHNHANERLDGKFLHLIGHGLGIDYHESPQMSDELKENMIITIEPGIYFPEKYGIRIEDDIVVKEKPIVLNKTTKELIIIN
ncbi:aminopeptidase P family protein [Candidatus Pacearchaeota archaeon]|nr:aminopeptidase P family protein [Candidatus Pacearchaeota archaeon]